MAQANRLVTLLNQHFPGEDGHDVFSLRDGHVEATLDGFRLQSRFQPLISSGGGQVIGHQGLLQLSDTAGRQLPSTLFFNRFATGGALARADRICRGLHLANHILTAAPGYLFLSLHPRHLPSVAGPYGKTFSAISLAAGLAPEKIVLQILADAAQDESQLARAVEQFKAHGFLIALDDFGCDHGRHTVDRLFCLKPHVVMFSHDLLQAKNSYALSRLVRTARTLGALSGLKGKCVPPEAVQAKQIGFDILSAAISSGNRSETLKKPA